MMEKLPIVIEHQRITKPGQLGLGFTPDDGLGLWLNREYIVRECIIDLSALPLEELDEAAAVTWGASATFERCVIKGAGKLLLCGSGDAHKREVEQGRRVWLKDCVLEDFGRRGPEVQAGMRVVLEDCLIRNWGKPDRHTVRDFGAWAHHGGRIDAVGCVFWQDTFWRPWRQFWGDCVGRVGQAWNDERWRGLLRLSTWLPGVCLALRATAGGEAFAWCCWRNRWWIAFPWRRTTALMAKADALKLVADLEDMAARLNTELPTRDGKMAHLHTAKGVKGYMALLELKEDDTDIRIIFMLSELAKAA